MYKIKTRIITPRRPKTAPKTATSNTLLPNQAGAALAATGREPLFGIWTITGIMLDLYRKYINSHEVGLKKNRPWN